MKTAAILILISLSALHFYCNAHNEKGNAPIKGQAQDTTFLKDIPYRPGRPDIFYREMKRDIADLNLDTLEAGFDSLQIRIWCTYGNLIYHQLIILKKTQGKWSGHLLSFNGNDRSQYTGESRFFNSRRRSLTPKSGWEKFTRKLFALQITTLPSITEIPNLKPEGTGGDGENGIYAVEVATPHLYRFYRYEELAIYKDRFWQASNMEKILRLMEKEFAFKRINM
ncbi:hypothetical protein V9K67_26195 [Paraflavisolibacter sp. H34]|uniref:hypothetical protein n=1 Tax=Huijunlia imazamoxiresistens TaxID=3127457 RepID=UPI0030187E67